MYRKETFKGKKATDPPDRTSNQSRISAEFKHTTRRRKSLSVRLSVRLLHTCGQRGHQKIISVPRTLYVFNLWNRTTIYGIVKVSWYLNQMNLLIQVKSIIYQSLVNAILVTSKSFTPPITKSSYMFMGISGRWNDA